MRGNPEREIRTCLDTLSEVDAERKGYLRLAAKGRMTDEELDEALAELEENRIAAESELQALRARRETIEQLEHDRDALLESYARMVPEELDALAPEERQHVYKLLRLKVIVSNDGSLEVSGVLRDCFAPENQDERFAVAADEVYLTIARPVVALDQLVPDT